MDCVVKMWAKYTGISKRSICRIWKKSQDKTVEKFALESDGKPMEVNEETKTIIRRNVHSFYYANKLLNFKKDFYAVLKENEESLFTI